MEKDYIKMFKEADELFKHPFDSARYAIAKEIRSFIETTDEELLYLVALGIELYENHDYATPVGVGCTLGYFLEEWWDKEEIKEHNVMAITYEEVEDAYYSSNWH